MISVSFSSSFIKSFHKLKKSNSLFESQFDDKLNIFLSNPYDSRLKTHKLSGKLSLLWSFSINFQIRVIFVFVDSQKVIFEKLLLFLKYIKTNQPFSKAKTRLGYVDMPKDKESNLGDHGEGNRLRKYNSEVGRFLAVDPLWEDYKIEFKVIHFTNE